MATLAGNFKQRLWRQRHHGFSVIDQVVLSGGNFALSAVLIRLWAPAEFGLFTLLLSFGLLATGLQNALVSGPLSVLRPEENTADFLPFHRTLLIVNSAYIVVATVVAAGLVATFLPAPATLAAFAAFVFATLWREYARSVYFAELRVTRVLFIDVCYVLIGLIFLVEIYRRAPDMPLPPLFLALTVAAGTPAALVLLLDRKLDFLLPLSEVARRYRAIFRQSGWSLIGVVTTELHSRGYIYLVSAVAGNAALGALQAARLIFQPMVLLATAWGRTARVMLAKLLKSQQRRAALSFVGKSIALLLFGWLCFCTLIWLAWPMIDRALFQPDYPDIAGIVALWAIAALWVLIRNAFSIYLQAMVAFRYLAFATLYSSVASLPVLWWVIHTFGYPASIVVIILADIVLAVVLFQRATQAKLPLRQRAEPLPDWLTVRRSPC